MTSRMLMRVGIAALVLGVLLPNVAVGGPLPRVEREVMVDDSIVPGKGRALISGEYGIELLEFGQMPIVEPAELGAEEAIAVARRFISEPLLRAWASPTAFAETVVSADSEQVTVRSGWAVDFVNENPPEAIRVFVDGLGTPRGFVQLHKGGLARAFDRSPCHGPLLEVDLEGLVSEISLDGVGFSVRGCGPREGPHCEITAFAHPDLAGDWLFDFEPTDPFDPFTEVSTFWHLSRAMRDFASMGLRDYPLDLLAIVNFRYDSTGDGQMDPYPNAVYVPRLFGHADGLIFGHTGEGSMAHDADVIRHELAHAATVHLAELHSRLDEYGLDHVPGMIAEAVADYFAAAISGEAVVGEHVGMLLGLGEGGIRRLDQELECPGDLVGLPHDDSQVLSSALWSARESVGPAMDEVLATALRAMPHHPSLSQAALAIIATASVHLGESGRAEVERILVETGLSTCSRFRPLTEEGELTGHLPVTRQMARMSPGPFQYRYQVPEGTAEVRITLEIIDPEPEAEVVMYVRIGAPVTYSLRVLGDRVWFETVFDLSGHEEIVLGSDFWDQGQEPLIFVSPANLSNSMVAYRLRVERIPSPPVFESRIASLSPPPIPGHEPENEPEPAPGGCNAFPVLLGVLILLVGGYGVGTLRTVRWRATRLPISRGCEEEERPRARERRDRGHRGSRASDPDLR